MATHNLHLSADGGVTLTKEDTSMFALGIKAGSVCSYGPEPKSGPTPYPGLNSSDVLYVVTPIFNPHGYEAIYRNFRRYAEQMEANPRVVLITVECALADRPYVVTSQGNPHHVQVRSQSTLWIKENLINLGLQRIKQQFPADRTGKVAWIDGDVDFLDPLWAEKTLLALDHNAVVQPWSEAIYGGPDERLVGHTKSFCWYYSEGKPWAGHPPKYGELWHPGFAWAARMEVISGLGGVLDFSIVGHGDLHMALALIGKAEESLQHEGVLEGLPEDYARAVMQWQAHADEVVRGHVGYVKGMIRHHWHGRQTDRKYESRWSIPVTHRYSPHAHLVRNLWGVYEIVSTAPAFRRDLNRYFAQRNDDANTAD